MFEGIRANPPQRQPRVIAKLVAGIDYLVPFLDIGYVFFWIPGLILTVFGYPLIVSWWSMLIIPITLLVYNALRRWQEHHVFRVHQIDLPADRRGFWGYLFLYQALSSVAAGNPAPQAPVAASWRLDESENPGWCPHGDHGTLTCS